MKRKAVRRFSVLILLALLQLVFAASPRVPVEAARPSAPPMEIGLLSPAAPPEPLPLQLEFVGRIGGPTETVAVSGTLAYISEGFGLTIFDVSVPTETTRLASLPLSLIADVEVVGSLVYAVGYGLHVIDVRDPSHPWVYGRNLDVDGDTLEVAGNRVYVTDGSTLTVLDVSDLSRPQPLGSTDVGDSARGLDVVGELAYVAAYSTGLKILDVSDPGNIRLVGTYMPAAQSEFSQRVYDVAAASGLVYAITTTDYIDEPTQLQVLDVSDPSSPRLVGAMQVAAEKGIQVVGDLVYLSARGLQIVDVSNPASPKRVGSYEFPAGTGDVQVVGSLAYLVDSYLGLQIFDVSDPASPALIWAGYDPPTYPNEVEVVGDLAYVATVEHGIQILDVADPRNPRPLGVDPTIRGAETLDVVGTLAYVGTDRGDLAIFDVGDPTHPVLIGNTHVVAHWITDLQVAGQYAYLTSEDPATLSIVDVTTPSAPRLVGRYVEQLNALEAFSRVEVVRDHAYVLYHYRSGSALRVIDIHDPAAPADVTPGFRFPGDGPTGVEVVGNLAYFTVWDYGLLILDVSDPGNFIQIGSHESERYLEELDVVGSEVYAVGNGVAIYDVSDPARPVLRGRSGESGGGSLDVAGDMVYTVGLSIRILRVKYVGYPVTLPLIRR